MDTTLRYPIILIHGWTDKPAATGTWKVVERSLTKNGIHFFVPSIARFGTIEERVQRLIQEMASLYPKGQRVHLMGHSLGGIVARDMASRSNLPFEVLTVTTLGTPNRGLKYLDLLPIIDGTTEHASHIRDIFGTDFGGLTNLSSKFMSDFNFKTMNNASVKYFSWAGQIVIPSVSYAPHWLIVAPYYRHSDGIVGTETAAWGEDLGPGTHLGTIPGLTHSSIVCVEVMEKTLPHLFAAEEGHTAKVEVINGGYRDQIARRFEGHKSSVKGRFYAIRDARRHSEDDSTKNVGYVYNAEKGYKYT